MKFEGRNVDFSYLIHERIAIEVSRQQTFVEAGYLMRTIFIASDSREFFMFKKYV